MSKIPGIGFSDKEWNRIIDAVNEGKTIENADWDLTEEEKEVFKRLKRERDELLNRFPNAPVMLAPYEKEW